MSRVVFEFVLRLLEPRPSCRLTAEAALETAWLNSVDGCLSELSLVSQPSSLSLRGQSVKELTMVKNYGSKPVSAHQKERVPLRIDLWLGLITGTEWGFLDPPNSTADNNELFETSSGSESDVSADIPAHLTARQIV